MLVKGQLIEVFEYGTVRGTAMMRTSEGWISRLTKEGKSEEGREVKLDVNVYQVQEGENLVP
eukprot:SAG11_NODE_7519_length_1135_cov_1.782819_1_plen_61_part_10